jgi:adenosine kinase
MVSTLKGKLVGLGNPIIDISNEINEEGLEKYGLKFGQTIFANDQNKFFFDDLEKAPNCSYIPGGSVTNSIRVTNWMLNGNKDYGCGIIGCIGNDEYGRQILSELLKVNVQTILEVDQKDLSSRCGCGIFKKERCLMPEIRASNKLSMGFIEENLETILKADILFVEGYFLIDCWDIVLFLTKKFKDAKKKVAFTLSAAFMVEFHYEKIKILSDMADLIFCNEEEAATMAKMLTGKSSDNDLENSRTIHANLPQIDRLLIVTCGKNPVHLTRYDYTKKDFSFSLSVNINVLSSDEIVDTNGCGDAFVGGFMSEYLRGSEIEKCALAGNYASSVIIRNIGCTYPEKPEFK